MFSCGKAQIYFYGRPGGMVPTGEEIAGVIKKAFKRNIKFGEVCYLNDI
jgi:hypothetical protein